jgi:hypothetical protein
MSLLIKTPIPTADDYTARYNAAASREQTTIEYVVDYTILLRGLLRDYRRLEDRQRPLLSMLKCFMTHYDRETLTPDNLAWLLKETKTMLASLEDTHLPPIP